MVRDRSSSSGPTDGVPGPVVRALHRRLLAWYARERRDLPWRRTRDPYAVWLSEVMLQQTQVATALPYYERFLARFPSLESLSRAREADVLHAWAGLGYYRRARSFRSAALQVVREHAGHVPDDPERFGRLPGVGRYTCGAVLSIAFGRPLPVLDGNVARVLARLTARPLAIRDPRDARALWTLAESLVPMREPGDWNQAMMELGARICTPRAPRCGACPVAARCRAHALGREEEFPPVAPRRAAVTVRRAVALVGRAGRLLMTRRDGTLLAGLWEPPGIDLAPGTDGARALGAALKALGVRAALRPLEARVRHTITHRRFEVELWGGTLLGAAPRGARVRLVDPEAPAVALSALARKAARAGAAAATPGTSRRGLRRAAQAPRARRR